jgi:hypothetical membrane protein
MTAEALYPADYDVHRNTVSDLAARRPDDVVRQPSAAILNTTMIVTGALIVIAAVLLYRSRAGAPAVLPVAGLGLGMIGVGISPGNTVMAVHQLVSITTSLCGGVAAILTARLTSRPLPPVHVVLGGVALAFLLGYTILGELPLFDQLGAGGVERWIVYPVVLWIVISGTGLAASRRQRRQPRRAGPSSPPPADASTEQHDATGGSIEGLDAGPARGPGRLAGQYVGTAVTSGTEGSSRWAARCPRPARGIRRVAPPRPKSSGMLT